ncbi:C-type lectin domain family 4 member E [Ornithorhynchus anatinus]|uniref:C-type lectin domain family 4 member E n=1 Tax=Ornithorhynchus anatinus TaxID=9258 RepID=UPI0010A794BE|nr:C-type lectin domain family 4 member E [Ornithorhynchus anatinus]
MSPPKGAGPQNRNFNGHFPSRLSGLLGRGCCCPPWSPWAAATVPVLLLSACFIARCLVTQRAFSQFCEEEGTLLRLNDFFSEISCYSSGSGSIRDCCPRGWKHFQSHCYFFSSDTLTWSSSRLNCTGMGAQLVVINSQEEQEFIFQSKPRRREFFLGLTDKHVEGKWTWVDGTPYDPSRSFWDLGEPNNIVGVEDCATTRDSPNAKETWNDVTCFSFHYRICEMPAQTLSAGKKGM